MVRQVVRLNPHLRKGVVRKEAKIALNAIEAAPPRRIISLSFAHCLKPFRLTQRLCKLVLAKDVQSVAGHVKQVESNLTNLANTTTERFNAVEGSIGETHEKLEDLNERLTKVETGTEKTTSNTGSASSGLFPTASNAVPVWVDDFLRPGDPSVIRINVDKRNKACFESVKGIVDKFLEES